MGVRMTPVMVGRICAGDDREVGMLMSWIKTGFERKKSKCDIVLNVASKI